MGNSTEDIEQFRAAGKILRKVKEDAKKLVKLGVKYLDVAEKIESQIRKLGAKPAFPVNISVNEIAAHYTPIPNDTITFKQGDLVKIDIGVHVDGYPSDSAFSVSVGEQSPLIPVVDDVLELACKMCKPGMKVGEIGSAVQKFIESKGYRPIANLTGHSMERWNLHSGISIPNISTPTTTELKEGMIIAIEPFVTDGDGRVTESKPSAIYRLISKRVRLPKARKALSFIQENFGTLPFASRWMPSEFLPLMGYLVNQKALHNYPILKEIKNGRISQAEHTVLVSSPNPEILT